MGWPSSVSARTIPPRTASLHDADSERLIRMFAEIRPLLNSKDGAPEGRPLPDEAAIQGTFEALAKPLAGLRSEGRLINPWTVAGLKRGEVRNAAVLAALWTPQIGGTAATSFLEAFLGRLKGQGADRLPRRDQLDRGYVVRTEHNPVGDTTERVDITIEGEHFVLGIEVKIDAPEGRSQLERYAHAIRDRGARLAKEPSIVFLAPFAASVEALSATANIVPIAEASWKDLTAAAHTVLRKRQQDFTFNDRLIAAFAAHIETF